MEANLITPPFASYPASTLSDSINRGQPAPDCSRCGWSYGGRRRNQNVGRSLVLRQCPESPRGVRHGQTRSPFHRPGLALQRGIGPARHLNWAGAPSSIPTPMSELRTGQSLHELVAIPMAGGAPCRHGYYPRRPHYRYRRH
jgi:hypothetical protein